MNSLKPIFSNDAKNPKILRSFCEKRRREIGPNNKLAIGTWTLQEVYSINETPAKWGLWSSQPPREEFFIDTNDLDSVRMGVSSYERHAIVPHEAYQAIYASGQEQEIFDGYQKHVISDGHVLRNM